MQARRVLTACRLGDDAQPDDNLDQCPATVGTTMRRLRLLLANENIKERKLLLLGDDDLLSVAINAAEPSASCTVIDLDVRLLARIERWSQPGCEQLLCHDLRSELPVELQQRFDVVFTDPPYTRAGQLLFLKRAITALRPVRGSSLYLCSSKFYLDDEKVAGIVAAARSGGLQLKSSYENFNRYRAPPDVQADLKRARSRRSTKFFHSTLFHFTLRANLVSPALIPTPSRDIYNYQEE